MSVAEPPATHSVPTEEKQVVSQTTAYMITNMLSDVIDHGTGRAARNSANGTAIAGKTGTSRDGWFVGYTPNLVCVVWIGFDDNSQLGLTGAASALPAWMEFVEGAVALRPELGGKNFECPEGIKFVEIDSENGMLSTLTCPRRELIAVSERVQPNVECFTHGNLPQDEYYQPEVIVVQEESVIARGQSRKKDRVIEFQPYQSTRVDINSRGKPVLVNDLR
jgi:penicillin-binding protein 1B